MKKSLQEFLSSKLTIKIVNDSVYVLVCNPYDRHFHWEKAYIKEQKVEIIMYDKINAKELKKILQSVRGLYGSYKKLMNSHVKKDYHATKQKNQQRN